MSSSSASTAQSTNTSTSSQLRTQWTNPSDVLSLLLIIGGDIIQKALAQTSGGVFTPVCFSFGWVAYSLTALIGIVGDGRLLPDPDHPAKVFNLGNGYARDNKNWIIGRILRDNGIQMARTHPLKGRSIRISIYQALPRTRVSSFSPASFGRARLYAFLVIIVQHVIAAIPVILDREWGVLMITGAGTVLAWCVGYLPQWTVEKMPNKQHSAKNFAITSGNGSRDIMVVIGNGNSLDLEELATLETPRSERPWENIKPMSKIVYAEGTTDPKFHRNGNPVRAAYTYRGIPVGYWITAFICGVQCLFWFGLLITVAGMRTHTWYLLLVGGLGMLQNAAIAGVSRTPEKRSLPLALVEIIMTARVMDGLMQLEEKYSEFGYSLGRPLLEEFFPGKLTSAETAWWRGDKTRYQEEQRNREEKQKHGDARLSARVEIFGGRSSSDRGLKALGSNIRSGRSSQADVESGVQRKRDSPSPRNFLRSLRKPRSHSDQHVSDLRPATQKSYSSDSTASFDDNKLNRVGAARDDFSLDSEIKPALRAELLATSPDWA